MIDPAREIAQSLPRREGVPNLKWWTDRKELCTALEDSVRGEQAGSTWLHGPARIGKTSIADWLEFKCGEEGWARVFRVNRGAPITCFDELVLNLYRLFGLPPQQDFRALRTHLAGLTQTTVVVVDEFDRLSMILSRDDQAELRALSHDHPRFCWLFITRLLPEQLCQRHDEQSWLLGTVQQHVVGFWTQKDVDRLVHRVASQLKLDDSAQAKREIWAAVGGAPMLVIDLLRAWLSRLPDDDPHAALTEAVRRRRADLRTDLTGLWKQLPLSARRDLLEASQSDDAAAYDVPDLSGAVWLRDVGREVGLVPTPDHSAEWSTTEALAQLLELLVRPLGETRAVLRQGARAFHLYETLRECRDEAHVKRIVEVLHQMVCEGSAGDPKKLDQGPLRDATEALRRSPGWEALIVLRNFYDHDAHAGHSEKGAKERDEAASTVFSRLVKVRFPSEPEHYRLLQQRLLAEVHDALRAAWQVISHPATTDIPPR
jgi:hypothetical protein